MRIAPQPRASGAIRWLRTKVMQARHAADDVVERSGNHDRRGVGDVRFPVNAIVMDLGTKSMLHLGSGAAEDDGIMTAPDAESLEAFGLEPAGNLVQIVFTEAEAIGELLGREPLVVEGRRAILLLREKLVEILLLARRGGHE